MRKQSHEEVMMDMPDGNAVPLSPEELLSGEGVCGVAWICSSTKEEERDDWYTEAGPFYCGIRSCQVCGPMIEANELTEKEEPLATAK